MPTVDLEIIKKSKQCNEFGEMNSLIQQYISDKYNGSIQIFTDGSKDPDTGRTGAAVHIPQFNVSIIKRTSDHLAVFTVELLAILLALWWIEEGRSSRCIICSDSMAALISISNGKSTCRPDLVYEVLQSLFKIERMQITVGFLWVPSHAEVEGNEVVDMLAKKALKQDIQLGVPLSKSEVKTIIKSEINKVWQEQWDRENKGRFLHRIQRQVVTRRQGCWNRRCEVIITRLRIGHTS